MSEPIRLFVWAEAAQRDLIVRTVAAGGFHLLAAGGPEQSDAQSLSQSLDVPAVSDLRQAALREDIDVLWLLSPQPIEPEERRLLQERPFLTVTSEPRPSPGPEGVEDIESAGFARVVPLMRHSPGFLTARQALDEFGPVRSAQACFRSGPDQGSLLARLFDAMDVLLMLLGEADQIHATHAALATPPPGAIASVNGQLAASLDCPDGRCGAILVSNCPGPWSRQLTIIGDGGSLEVDDQACIWRHTAGGSDERDATPPRAMIDPGALVARHIERLLQRREEGEPAPENARLIALCSAVRLSARTGQVESPRTMLDMMSRT